MSAFLTQSRNEPSKLIWIIGFEPDDNITIGTDQQSVSLHRNLRERVGAHIRARFFLAANHGLEVVSMQMERMLAGVQTVQNNLNHLVLFQDESIGVSPVNAWIGGCLARGQSCVKRGYFRSNISLIVEESAAGIVRLWYVMHGEEFNAY